MCEYSGRLAAWLDRELPDEEASNVERHVERCAECQGEVRVCEQVGRAVLEYYEAAIVTGRQPRYRRMAPAMGGVGALAAMLLLFIWSRPGVEPMPYPPPLAIHPPAIAFHLPQAPRVAVRGRHAVVPTPAPRRQWSAQEPTVEVALPADAMFPPGAVPEGFSFIADVRP